MLLNNAGLSSTDERRLTKHGFEYAIGVNHFGHFLLTALLWERIVLSEGFRVINVSSLGHTAIHSK